MPIVYRVVSGSSISESGSRICDFKVPASVLVDFLGSQWKKSGTSFTEEEISVHVEI